MLRRVFSLIKRMCFMIQIQEFFLIIDKNQHAFLVLKGVTPTFSNLGILLKIDMKNCPLLGKLLSVWRTIQYCPNQPNLPRQLKTLIAFSMFPTLCTSQWSLYSPAHARAKKRRKCAMIYVHSTITLLFEINTFSLTLTKKSVI